MAREAGSIVGSGTLGNAQNLPTTNDGSRWRTGTQMVLINPEDLSAQGEINSTVLSVSGTAVPLPERALPGRRSLALQVSSSNLYIGNSGVTAADGWLIGSGQSIALDVTPLVEVYGISDGTAVVRILELS